jgi:hypothetical protein
MRKTLFALFCFLISVSVLAEDNECMKEASYKNVDFFVSGSFYARNLGGVWEMPRGRDADEMASYRYNVTFFRDVMNSAEKTSIGKGEDGRMWVIYGDHLQCKMSVVYDRDVIENDRSGKARSGKYKITVNEKEYETIRSPYVLFYDGLLKMNMIDDMGIQ